VASGDACHELCIRTELFVEIAANEYVFVFASTICQVHVQVVDEASSWIGCEVACKSQQLILLCVDCGRAGVGDVGVNYIVTAEDGHLFTFRTGEGR
jgi:hypothetical protein